MMYNINRINNLYDSFDNDSYINFPYELNIFSRATFRRIDSRLCCICLEGNNISFYEYDLPIFTHTCLCKPIIHKQCFDICLKNKNNCIICDSRIVITPTLKEKIKYLILTNFIISIRYLMTSFALFIALKSWIYIMLLIYSIKNNL